MYVFDTEFYKRFYAPGQVRQIYRFIPQNAEYFILVGPANGCEAQEISINFPLKIIGFEPSRAAYQFQLENNFPGALYNQAISNEIGKLKFYNKSINQGTFKHANNDIDNYDVDTITMKSFIEKNPDINNIVLWADIEGSEYEMLLGFEEYLDRVLCLNLELAEDPDNRDGSMQRINNFLLDRGFKLKLSWNLGRPQPNGEFLRGDFIYVRE